MCSAPSTVEETWSRKRVARLNELRDRGWLWSYAEVRWETGYDNLVRFTTTHGSAAPEQSAVDDSNFPIGKWVSHQWTAHSNGRLSPDQARRLSELPGCTWELRAARWERGYELLTRFVAREDHALVPNSHVEDGYPLGKWITKQRQMHSSGRLQPDRIARLDAFKTKGWAWNVREESWDSRYELLLQYVRRTGDARVPVAHSEGGFRLGQWVNGQRNAGPGGRLAA